MQYFQLHYLELLPILPFILEILNVIIFKKDGEQKQNTFTPKIAGVTGAIYRAFITFGSLPYKAYVSAKSNSNNFIQNFSEQKTQARMDDIRRS